MSPCQGNLVNQIKLQLLFFAAHRVICTKVGQLYSADYEFSTPLNLIDQSEFASSEKLSLDYVIISAICQAICLNSSLKFC